MSFFFFNIGNVCAGTITTRAVSFACSTVVSGSSFTKNLVNARGRFLEKGTFVFVFGVVCVGIYYGVIVSSWVASRFSLAIVRIRVSEGVFVVPWFVRVYF